MHTGQEVYRSFLREINIYMQRDARRALRRERLYCDVSYPLEVYDEVVMNNLFRFERVHHIISITEDVNEDLQHVTGRTRASAPTSVHCISILCYRLHAAVTSRIDRRTSVTCLSGGMGSYRYFATNRARQF